MPKSAAPTLMLRWSNWRLACADCNNRRNARQDLIDPVREDPGEVLGFDLVIGRPFPRLHAGSRRAARGQRTLEAFDLDNEVLRDARRRVLHEALMRLQAVAVHHRHGHPRAARRVWDRFLADLTPAHPHRAILRELILESDADVNPHAAIVATVLQRHPDLRAWAEDPIRAGRPSGPSIGSPTGRKRARGGRTGYRADGGRAEPQGRGRG